MPIPRLSRVAAPLVGALSAVALLGFAPAASAATTATVLHVNANTGADSPACGPVASPCKTISRAVTNAAAGDTIEVAGGTYNEQVTVSKRLTIVGPGWSSSGPASVSPPAPTTISPTYNGFLVTGGGAGSTIKGFLVQNAYGEGILAEHTSHVTIQGNIVIGNDTGTRQSSPTYPECQANGSVPGDCGEGIHLMSVTNSVVDYNSVFENSGGILLTDELGPAAHNLVAYNNVSLNLYDCGITVASHNPNAAPKGVPAPKVAGIYDNRFIGNYASQNGIAGFGAGLLLAGAGPGTAVYDNLVENNTLVQNGLGGVTLHDHAPGQYMDGNAIVKNTFSGNDTVGGNGAPGDSSTFGATGGGLHKSADVIIFSGYDTVLWTVISGNHFASASYGIWTYKAPSILSMNSFETTIATRSSQSPPPAKVTITGPKSAAVGSTITLSGTAEPGQKVALYRVMGSTHRWLKVTTASAKGAWKLKVTLAKADEVFQAVSYGQRSRWLTVK
ncbi:MAG TPA: right-handed parallel beta-helix repeat-containing protein [Acidimicrobiales bacterium]|nr:right-handed parallel beta-helix repeat-containing protein [Acidimicrobiales bacterium]